MIFRLLCSLVIVATPFQFVCAAAEPKSEVKHVTPADAAPLVQQKKVTVLDIRTPGEFASGHLDGAVNVDFYGADFKKKIEALDRSKPYLVHCASGGRSTKSLDLFKQLKFEKVYHLDGGMKAWEKAGQPVVK